ncbi:MAG TPA: hypothetical protein O0Y06_08045 [Methanocorpusculum sp.]|nr:hypothetical protein [Methanocorpusculum sp.]HJK80836.1 hypothetical protein [Methanocorpusculum sp.]
MVTKREAVLKAMKYNAGRTVTAREVGKAVNLTAIQAAYQLHELAAEGIISRIVVDTRECKCLWKYPAADPEEVQV